MKRELKKYIKKNIEKKNRLRDFLSIFLLPIILIKRFFCYSRECEEEHVEIGKIKDAFYDEGLNDYIKNNEKYSSFQTMLFKMIDERKIKDSDVYNRVHLDRRLFSKIRNDENYHPSKETIILLGFSLELNIKEIEDLLESASYSLPKNNYYDLIIRFCFINNIYNIVKVNELLLIYNCKLFNY